MPDRSGGGGDDGRDSNRSVAVPLGESDPSDVAVSAVASLTGVPAIDLAPLYEAVDPDHLDALVASAADDADLTVSFRTNGCAVTVTATEVQARLLE